MDIIGSILKTMDTPPTIVTKAKLEEKRQRKILAQQQLQEKEKLRKFREKVENQVNKFLKDGERKFSFEPMDKVERSITHDVADIAGIPAYSFGMDGVDRCVMIWRLDSPPSETELQALRKGEEYIPRQQPVERPITPKVEERAQSRKLKSKPPVSDYKQKYEHIIGKDSAKAAAKITSTNSQYGFVPSANKKDSRTIEQTLADIQARKKQKTN